MSIWTRLRRERRLQAGPTCPCAAGCGEPVNLTEPHHTVSRAKERVDRRGGVTPTVGIPLAYTHRDCWPGDDAVVTLTVLPGEPGQAVLTRGVPERTTVQLQTVAAVVQQALNSSGHMVPLTAITAALQDAETRLGGTR
jgi:hypothetical protein